MALVIWKDDDDKYKGINVPKGDRGIILLD